MSKELEKLSEIKVILDTLLKLIEDIFATDNEPVKDIIKKSRHALKQIPKIETALKRTEELEIENSEQFKEKWVQDNLVMTFELNVAKNKLKALEIIKKKNIDTLFFRGSRNADEYNNHCSNELIWIKITQEEYDILKEVLL